MQMIINIIKNTLQLLVMIWVVSLLSKYFFRRTLLGRIIVLFSRSVWQTLRFTYQNIKRLGQIAYTDTKKFYKYIDEQCKKYSDKKQEKKAVNDNNVINFKKAKKQHNKKHV